MSRPRSAASQQAYVESLPPENSDSQAPAVMARTPRRGLKRVPVRGRRVRAWASV